MNPFKLVWFSRAVVWRVLGSSDRAHADLGKALKRSPGNWKILQFRDFLRSRVESENKKT